MSRPKRTYDRMSIETRQQVIARFGKDSIEFRQADHNWRAASDLCAHAMEPKMVASHGTDAEQGWWYANDGTRIKEIPQPKRIENQYA